MARSFSLLRTINQPINVRKLNIDKVRGQFVYVNWFQIAYIKDKVIEYLCRSTPLQMRFNYGTRRMLCHLLARKSRLWPKQSALVAADGRQLFGNCGCICCWLRKHLVQPLFCPSPVWLFVLVCRRGLFVCLAPKQVYSIKVKGSDLHSTLMNVDWVQSVSVTH